MTNNFYIFKQIQIDNIRMGFESFVTNIIYCIPINKVKDQNNIGIKKAVVSDIS